MKQVTKTFNVFDFSELSDKAQEKAFNWLYGDVIDDRFNFFEDDCFMVLDEVFGIKPLRLHYSFSNSQGDGFSFDCDNFISGKVLDMIDADDKVSQATKDNIKRLADDLEVTVKNTGRYTYHHRNQVSVSLSSDYDGLVPSYIIEDIEKAFAEVYITIAKQLEDNGYALMKVTAEDVAQYADSMDFDFTEDGDIYYE